MKTKLNTIDIVKDFVEICSKYKDSNIDVIQGRYIISGKSILGIFSLDLTEPVNIVIDSENENSKVSFYNEIQKWKVNDSV
ncbi:MAG: HPr family phosphocarrier protein [Lachnospiraceae bacterium]|nr:HPr family phosphocarrier protein [Lachnospiraceae bacterium]